MAWIGKATAVRTVRRVTLALTTLAKKYIVWPTGEAAVGVIDGFARSSGFPGVIGAIDGTHIEIPAPNESAAAYVNRKGYHSIHLQAVCDSEAVFTHCYAGNVGSVHDARVFRLSAVHNFLNDETKFPNDSHIIGDAAYGLHPQLLTPYADNGHLSQRQKNFNFTHASARMAIERAFGLLKGRWRSLLHTLAMQDLLLEQVPIVILSCCVLHNICSIRRDRLLAGLHNNVNLGRKKEAEMQGG
ncbi:putative nuclease HARBI1 [Ischnura elegans]|uniref:putative nuclease HARBI1 n=1 Tax=Ischnura elegans TaxID=197161 RepID=UPI001ED8B0A1|nr:putative nuclease HARBI1 [Ischnura elegans]